MDREEQIAEWLEREARNRAAARFREHKRRAAFLLCERRGAHHYSDYDAGYAIRVCVNCQHKIPQPGNLPFYV